MARLRGEFRDLLFEDVVSINMGNFRQNLSQKDALLHESFPAELLDTQNHMLGSDLDILNFTHTAPPKPSLVPAVFELGYALTRLPGLLPRLLFKEQPCAPRIPDWLSHTSINA